MPIQAKLPALKAKHKNDPEALQYLASEEKEIEMYRILRLRRYVFYVFQICAGA
jgi:hypothetical protein